jgi:hypothetical protein
MVEENSPMRSWMLACVFICTAGFGGAAWAKLDVVFFNPGLPMTVFGVTSTN